MTKDATVLCRIYSYKFACMLFCVYTDKVKKPMFDDKTKQNVPPLREMLRQEKAKHRNAIVFPKVILMTERKCRDVDGNMALIASLPRIH